MVCVSVSVFACVCVCVVCVSVSVSACVCLWCLYVSVVGACAGVFRGRCWTQKHRHRPMGLGKELDPESSCWGRMEGGDPVRL